MIKYSFLCLIILLFFIGCTSTKYAFVVLRDVPENLSFAVYPASNYSSDVEFAGKIEGDILSAGVKVVTRPTVKQVVTKKEAERAARDGEVQNVAALGVSKEESYIEWDSTSASYVVFTDADSRRIKVVKKDTKEVLSTFILQGDSRPGVSVQEDEENTIHAMLSSLNIIAPVVREKTSDNETTLYRIEKSNRFDLRSKEITKICDEQVTVSYYGIKRLLSFVGINGVDETLSGTFQEKAINNLKDGSTFYLKVDENTIYKFAVHEASDEKIALEFSRLR